LCLRLRKPPSNRRCNLKQRAVAFIADYVSRRGVGRVVGLKPVASDDYVLAIEDVRDERVHVGSARRATSSRDSVGQGRPSRDPGVRVVRTVRRDPLRPRSGSRGVPHVYPVSSRPRRAGARAPPRDGGGLMSDKLRAAQEKLQEAVAELASGDDWKRMLKIASKFHRYSFNNHLMIFLQRPRCHRGRGLQPLEVAGSLRQEGREGHRDLRSVQVPHEDRNRRRTGEVPSADTRLPRSARLRHLPNRR
jgi:hypothetical protein